MANAAVVKKRSCGEGPYPHQQAMLQDRQKHWAPSQFLQGASSSTPVDDGVDAQHL